jgi:hypothetical protein
MPIFGNTVNITVGNSGSTSSLDAINFLYVSPEYGPSAASSSLGSISFNRIKTGSEGASGVFQITLPSPENSNTAGVPILQLAATGSASTPLFGIGIEPSRLPIGTLDIRSTTGSDPANLILRTNEDGIIEENEETGRIIFLIESSSYTASGAELISSGSTAAIFSRVKSTGSFEQGVFGNLFVQVNDADAITEPVDILELGYGASAFNDAVPAARISGGLDLQSHTPFVYQRNEQGFAVAYIGHDSSSINSGSTGILELYDGGFKKVYINPTSSKASYYSGSNNFGIGTKTPSASLHVAGDFIANNITASNISSSGNIDIGNRIGKAGSTTYIDFDTSTDNEIEIYNAGNKTVTFTSRSFVSASGGMNLSASLNPGSFTVLTYNTASGEIFFTSSRDVGQAASAPSLQPVLEAGNSASLEIEAAGFNTVGAVTASIVSASLTGSFSRVETEYGSNGGFIIQNPNDDVNSGPSRIFAPAPANLNIDTSGSVGITEIVIAGEVPKVFINADLDIENNSISASVISASGEIKADFFTGQLIGNGNSVITASIISASGIVNALGVSSSGYHIQNVSVITTGSAGLVYGSNNNATTINGSTLTLNSGDIVFSGDITSTGYSITSSLGQNRFISTSGAGNTRVFIGDGSNNDAFSQITFVVEGSVPFDIGPEKAKFGSTTNPISMPFNPTSEYTLEVSGSNKGIISSSNYIHAAEHYSVLAGAPGSGTPTVVISGSSSSPDGIRMGHLAGGAGNMNFQLYAGTERKVEIPSNNTSAIKFTNQRLEVSGSVSGSSFITSPTSSGAPSYTGKDGEMVAGSVGNDHYLFVYMAGAWRSSSLGG